MSDTKYVPTLEDRVGGSIRRLHFLSRAMLNAANDNADAISGIAAQGLCGIIEDIADDLQTVLDASDSGKFVNFECPGGAR